MERVGKILQKQGYALLALALLLLAFHAYTQNISGVFHGSLWGLTSRFWFWAAIAAPVAHQLYVSITWRLQLYGQSFTRRLGLQRAFSLYAAGFVILILSRLVTITLLAAANPHTLHMGRPLALALAALIAPLSAYLFYSVAKYFTFRRAMGIDHFDKHYNEPFVKKGIFKYTGNAMYTLGMLALYLPGLLAHSKAAIAAAVFNHIYIWVHYYTLERPDMKVIYGALPSK